MKPWPGCGNWPSPFLSRRRGSWRFGAGLSRIPPGYGYRLSSGFLSDPCGSWHLRQSICLTECWVPVPLEWHSWHICVADDSGLNGSPAGLGTCVAVRNVTGGTSFRSHRFRGNRAVQIFLCRKHSVAAPCQACGGLRRQGRDDCQQQEEIEISIAEHSYVLPGVAEEFKLAEAWDSQACHEPVLFAAAIQTIKVFYCLISVG